MRYIWGEKKPYQSYFELSAFEFLADICFNLIQLQNILMVSWNAEKMK